MTPGGLMALAHGTRCDGPHPCAFCGASADTPFAVPDTFTARDSLAAPHSPFVCRGCVIGREEVGEAAYPDGTRKAWGKAYRRTHSWLVTPAGAVPHFVAHLPALRRALLAPPQPPWAAVLVGPTNGVHHLYRAPVNLDPVHATVLVHGERANFTPSALRGRLRLACRIAALAGRPALDGEPSPALFAACLDADPAFGEAVAVEWPRVRTEPLTRLALFFAPKKEDCPDVVRELDAAPAPAP